jgi:DHA2 family methylenomycin A resistance protein-like MFS transporter
MTVLATRTNLTASAARPRLVLVAASLGVLLAQIDTSAVNLAVKSIGSDLHAGVSAMQWMVDSYNLVYASFLLTGGTLGDLYGHRRIFVLGLTLFAVGVLTCALAPNAAMLIAGRALSGLGAAFALPMSLVLLTRAYPERRERAHAMGIWASSFGLAMIIGSTVGGWLVDDVGWRSIFLLALPVCIVAQALTYVAVAESSEPDGHTLDIAGQSLAVIGLSAFAFAVIEGPHRGWSSQPIVAIAALALLTLALFALVEARTAGPLLPLSYLSKPAFAADLAAAALMTFGMYAMLFILPLYFQVARGATPFIAGLALIPMSASYVVVSQLVGYLTNRFGPRVVMTCGMACMGIGLFALARIGQHTNVRFIELALLFAGIGLGLNTAPVNGAAVAAVPRERSGTASGVLNTARMVGATLGVAILGAVFAAHAGQDAEMGVGFQTGFRAALSDAGAAEWLGALIALTFIRRDSLDQAS